MTLRKLVEIYLEAKKSEVVPRTWDRYRVIFGLLSKFWESNGLMDAEFREAFSDKNVRELVIWMAESNLCKSGIKLYVTNLVSITSWAYRNKYTQERIRPLMLRDIHIPMRVDSPKTAITQEEFDILYNIAEGPMKLFLKIAWETGLRKIDIARLQKKHFIDGEDPYIRMKPQKTIRFNIVTETPVSDETAAMIRDLNLKDPEDYFWPEVWNNYQKHRFVYGLVPLFQKSGIKKSFHSIRRGLVTRLIAQGYQPEMVAGITGQSLATVMLYVKPDIKTRRQMLGFRK